MYLNVIFQTMCTGWLCNRHIALPKAQVRSLVVALFILFSLVFADKQAYLIPAIDSRNEALNTGLCR